MQTGMRILLKADRNRQVSQASLVRCYHSGAERFSFLQPQNSSLSLWQPWLLWTSRLPERSINYRGNWARKRKEIRTAQVLWTMVGCVIAYRKN